MLPYGGLKNAAVGCRRGRARWCSIGCVTGRWCERPPRKPVLPWKRSSIGVARTPTSTLPCSPLLLSVGATSAGCGPWHGCVVRACAGRPPVMTLDAARMHVGSPRLSRCAPCDLAFLIDFLPGLTARDSRLLPREVRGSLRVGSCFADLSQPGGRSYLVSTGV